MKNLKRLFRSTSPGVLKSYFDKRGAEFPDDFEWSLDEARLANETERVLAEFPDDLEDDIRAG